jgi:hypothetical protein
VDGGETLEVIKGFSYTKITSQGFYGGGVYGISILAIIFLI